MSKKKKEPEPELVVVEPEPTFTVPAVQDVLVVEAHEPPGPEQEEAEVMLSAAQATANELSREIVDKSAALVLSIRVIQSAKKLADLLRA